MSSRWAESAEDAAADAARKADKDAKKRAKAAKQRKAAALTPPIATATTNAATDRPSKRRRLSPDHDPTPPPPPSPLHRRLLRPAPASWQPARSVERFDRLNHIEEGSYGFVSRAREEATGDIVAIKKLKLDAARDGGFAVTALREMQTLQAARGHRHVVALREVVVGESGDNSGSGSGSGGGGQDVYLVMDFLEHDLKTLQEDMAEPFRPSETKTLLLQLGSALEFLHARCILHRDLKTSNILLNNRGELKLADFGMARFVGDPAPPNLTPLVVTLWYRAPELLLGATAYDGGVDMWSLGCVFGELLLRRPLLQGKNEVDQLSKIFLLTGPPTPQTWPAFKSLPNARTLRLPASPPTTTPPKGIPHAHFPTLPTSGLTLLTLLLSLNPTARPTPTQMLAHPYFREHPRPLATEMMPSFPSKAGQEKRRRGRLASPSAPVRGAVAAKGLAGLEGEVDFSGLFAAREGEESGGGFALRVV
ncbi:hypothetical protein LTR08_001417 [Meristemomyces frigidus]|nr:hypothetical protein LTR08_001417 [Meristemomyces frigidus]